MTEKKTEKITVGGKEFALQHPGLKWALDHDYACRDRDNKIKTSDFVQGILDHVVVQPKGFKIDDFSSLAELQDFQEKVQSFL